MLHKEITAEQLQKLNQDELFTLIFKLSDTVNHQDNLIQVQNELIYQYQTLRNLNEKLHDYKDCTKSAYNRLIDFESILSSKYDEKAESNGN